MPRAEIVRRFSYHAPDSDKVKAHEFVRGLCRTMASELDEELPEGREKALALTHLEEVMMWANAAIARGV